MRRSLWQLVGCAALLSACRGIPPAAPTPVSLRQPPTQWGLQQPLDQKTCVSPSGRYALWVNPSDPDGKGKAFYRLSLDGKVLWEKEFPFTWVEAAVADDGTSCGYAYTEGEGGLGNLEVAILAPSGAVRLDEKHARKGSRFFHTNPDPKVDGWFMDPENDRMVVRVPDPDLNRMREVWWVYKLSNGERRELTPSATGEQVNYLVDAKPLRGTPLTVLHWYRFDVTMGSAFTLIDGSAKQVWRWDVPDDYESGEQDERRYELREEVFRSGALLDTGRPNHFELRLGKLALRVTFRAELQNGAWRVTEVGRAPFVEPPKPAVATLNAPARTLNILRKLVVPLEASPSSPIHDVGEFHAIPGDRFVFLRYGENPAICMVDGAGNLLKQIPMPKEGVGERRNAVLGWIGGTSFVLVASEYGTKESAKAWRVDAQSGALRPLPLFNSFRVEALAAFKDGSFATLSVEDMPFSMSDHLALFDAQGRKLWDIEDGGGFGGGDEEMLSPEDLAFDPSGKVVVLDVIRHALQFFGRDGRFLKLIDFDKKWNRRMNYPSQLTSLKNGGFLILDFGADKPCIEVDDSGKLVREYAPKLSNGKRVETVQDMRVDSKGLVWVTNGDLFLGLDQKGIAVRTLGLAPRASGMSALSDLFVAPDGSVVALEQDNAEVHAFSPDGSLKFVAKPLASDFDNRPNPSLDVTQSGDLYVSGGTGAGPLHFSPDGKRVGFQPYPDWEAKGSEKTFQMQPTWRWSGSRLLDERGKIVAELRRWPDQSWMLGGPSAMAPTGELMAYSGGSWRERDSDQRLAFFKPDGTPDGMAKLPDGLGQTYAGAFDGVLSYFTTEAGLVAVDRRGKAVWLYRPDGWTIGWRPFPSRGGLALWDGVKTVYWVEVPGPP